MKKQKRKPNNNNLLPRKIRRNKARNMIKNDGLNDINKKLKYYWNDIQNGAYNLD